MPRHLRLRVLAPLTLLALGLGLAGCVAYPAPYGYYGGYYGSYYPAYAYAPPPVIGFNFGWWGWGHRGWH